MDYKDAITYCREHDILKEDGTQFEFGDVSSAGAEPALLYTPIPAANTVILW